MFKSFLGPNRFSIQSACLRYISTSTQHAHLHFKSLPITQTHHGRAIHHGITCERLGKIFKEKFVNQYKTGEHITGQFAKLLIDQSGLVANSKANPDKPLVVLDNACGTGAVSSILQEELDDQAKSNLKLTCGDISPGMLDYVKHRIGVENWQNVEVETVDA